MSAQTVVLSPMARIRIIVWQDGTLSHDLPSNIASELEDYCQLQHYLKPNGNQPNPRRQKRPKPKPAKPEVYVPPRKYSTTLRLLDPFDSEDRLKHYKSEYSGLYLNVFRLILKITYNSRSPFRAWLEAFE